MGHPGSSNPSWTLFTEPERWQLFHSTSLSTADQELGAALGPGNKQVAEPAWIVETI